MGCGNTGKSGEGDPEAVSGTDSDTSTEAIGLWLRGGKATKSDEATLMNTGETLGQFDSTPSTASGKYSRKELSTQDVFWTCSLEEFHAMSDKQWASFGTAFYIAPDGFDTARKHVVRLE